MYSKGLYSIGFCRGGRDLSDAAEESAPESASVSAFAALAFLAATGGVAAAVVRPGHDPETLPHTHDLPPDHPHQHAGSRIHSRAFVIDDFQHDRPE